MSEQGSDQQRLVVQVADAVETHPAVHAPREVIEERAAEALEPLVDAPVQTFVPVLAEHQVVESLVEDALAAGVDSPLTAAEPVPSEPEGRAPSDADPAGDDADLARGHEHDAGPGATDVPMADGRPA